MEAMAAKPDNKSQSRGMGFVRIEDVAKVAGVSPITVSRALNTPDKVRDYCKKVIDGVAQDGGYIMDAAAIMQDVVKPENMRAMTDFTREYGVYDSGASKPAAPPNTVGEKPKYPSLISDMAGVCTPWEEKRKELPELTGDPDLVERIWKETDAMGNMFIWQCLVSF